MRQHWAIGEKPIGNMIKFLDRRRNLSVGVNQGGLDAKPSLYSGIFNSATSSRHSPTGSSVMSPVSR